MLRSMVAWGLACMSSLLFVHGTGVRSASFDKTFSLMRRRLSRITAGPVLFPCFWGKEHGSVLHKGSSLGREPVTHNEEMTLWSCLYADPLAELSAVADAAIPVEWPAVSPQGEELARTAAALPERDAVLTAIRDTPLERVFSGAVSAVLKSDAAERALSSATLYDDIRPVLARAIVAQAQRAADDEIGDCVPVDGDTQEEIVAVIVAELGGSYRGLGELAWRALGFSQVTRPLERWVTRIPDEKSAMAGDVMLFLSRGDSIRRAIADAIDAVEPPVTVLAHSLGGVAVVDLLIRKPLPSVELIVTVGSQAPYMYELDVLPALRYGAPLPGGFPRWANVYDPRDALAFRAENVFPGSPPGIRDHRIDNGVPFPRAHTAYFANKKFYSLLQSLW
jgi:hypothetical protein